MTLQLIRNFKYLLHEHCIKKAVALPNSAVFSTNIGKQGMLVLVQLKILRNSAVKYFLYNFTHETRIHLSVGKFIDSPLSSVSAGLSVKYVILLFLLSVFTGNHFLYEI